MEQQSYKNHVRYYPPHHFVFYPVSILLLGLSIYLSFHFEEQHFLWIGFSISLLLLIWVAFMMRQHYALINQNRIVRLEMRFRYFTLTGKRLELLEDKLTFGQIAALRFASDEEMPALLDRALQEQLSPDAIKKAVITWLPDHMRV